MNGEWGVGSGEGGNGEWGVGQGGGSGGGEYVLEQIPNPEFLALYRRMDGEMALSQRS